jgi:hypothetical protein
MKDDVETILITTGFSAETYVIYVLTWLKVSGVVLADFIWPVRGVVLKNNHRSWNNFL